MSYLGLSPDRDIALNSIEVVAREGQTIFSIVYNSYVEVYMTGVLLSQSDYTSNNGVYIELKVPAKAGQIVRCIGYDHLVANSTIVLNELIVSTAGQTVYNTTNDFAGTITSLFLNGAKLTADDYVVGNNLITLNFPAVEFDPLEIIGNRTFNIADTYTRDQIDGGVEVLNALKNVDGIDSGLDADLLDGKQLKDINKHDITYITKSGHNSCGLVIDGELYTTTSQGSSYTNATSGTNIYNYPDASGVLHNIRNVPIDEDSPLKKVGGFRYSFAFALFENGNLYTWGNNSQGTCGAGHYASIIKPILVATGVIDAYDHPSQDEFDVHNQGFFILKSDGLYAAGENVSGKLGIGSTTSSKIFTKCVGFNNTSSDNIIDVFPMGCGYGYTFVHAADGKIYFAGTNGSTVKETSFVETSSWADPNKTLKSIKVVGGGSYYNYTEGNTNYYNVMFAAMLIKYEDGTSEVKTYGDNRFSQLGLGHANVAAQNVQTPLNLPTDGSIVDLVSIGSGVGSLTALTTSGDIWSWGYNERGQIGDGSFVEMSTPTIVQTGIRKLFSNGMTSHYDGYRVQSYIQKDDGLYVSGSNNENETGTGISGGNISTYTKVKLPNDDNDVVDMGFFTTGLNKRVALALTSKSNLYTWGNNENGGIGSSGNDFLVPALVRIPWKNRD